MRYLGIDYGTKKVGLALSDDAGTMGFPHAVVPTDAKLAGTLAGLIRKEHIGAVVMGESLNFKGGDNPVAAAAKALAEDLMARAEVPVFFEPEMLTTQEARRDFEGEWHSSHDVVDSSAAALILTSYLSRTHDQHR